MKPLLALLALLTLSACAYEGGPYAPVRSGYSPQSEFFSHLYRLCGNSYAGRMVTNDPADKAIAGKPLTMEVRNCSRDEIRMPFIVGDDRSRTWVVSQSRGHIRLKHDHRHKDGKPDKITWYGGEAAGRGSSFRQEFPADPFTQEMFTRQGLASSVANVWALEIVPGRLFAYELTRAGRNFRVEFDLTRPQRDYGS